jgi:hypothetical protein
LTEEDPQPNHGFEGNAGCDHDDAERHSLQTSASFGESSGLPGPFLLVRLCNDVTHSGFCLLMFDFSIL